jgi:hypothetical protein
MTSSMDQVSEKLGLKVDNLDPEDRRLFFENKDEYLKHQIIDSPLLDQLCSVHLIMTRLSEGYERALAEFEERLEERTASPEGWRKSLTSKTLEELESPMPWLHPFKLAKEELKPLSEALETAVLGGETEEKELGMLQEVMGKYRLQFPLPSHIMKPRYPPRGVRVYR